MTIFIGLSGGSGSGKTTIAKRIKQAFSHDERVSTLELDSYYRHFRDLNEKERAKINYDHPDAIDFELLKHHLEELVKGRAIATPTYDFVHHARTNITKSIQPSDILILEGILTFHDPDIRSMLNMKIFVDTDADIRILRRMRRDMEQRGRSFEEVRRQYYETVRPMHNRYVEPTKQYADLVIPEGGSNIVAIDMLVTLIKHKLSRLSREEELLPFSTITVKRTVANDSLILNS